MAVYTPNTPPLLIFCSVCLDELRVVKPLQSLYTGFTQLSAGLCVGLAGLEAGFSVGIVGDAGIRANAQQPKLFTGMVLILIFSEVLGLYGVIMALLLTTKANGDTVCVPALPWLNLVLVRRRERLW